MSHFLLRNYHKLNQDSLKTCQSQCTISVQSVYDMISTKILIFSQCVIYFFCIYAQHHHIAFKSDFVSNTAGALGVSGASPMRCTNSAARCTYSEAEYREVHFRRKEASFATTGTTAQDHMLLVFEQHSSEVCPGS